MSDIKKVTMTDMQEFYERWARKDPLLHLSPSLPDGFLFRSIKSGWFEMAEEATDSAAKATEAAADKHAANAAAKATDALENEVVGKRILVRETINQKDNTIVQYGSEKTERGWTRHIVAFRQGEESPFPLPATATATASANAFTFANATATATSFATANASATSFA
jgi:hypothetical protein